MGGSGRRGSGQRSSGLRSRGFAALYDWVTNAKERLEFGPIRRRLLQDVSGDVLDIGAGTGANIPYYPAAATVTALEPNPYMRRRGTRRSGLASVTWIAGIAEDLPFPDKSFDAVVCTLVLCSVTDVEQALAEAHRVLRDQGRLIFFEHVVSRRLHKVQNLLNPLWKFIADGCNLNRDTRAHIETAGFQIQALAETQISPIMPAIYGWAVKR